DFHVTGVQTCALPILQPVRLIKLGAGLVEIGDLQIAAEPHLARVRRETAGQDLEERRFARAIGPDDADAVAAPDAGREVAENHALAIALGDAAGFDHQLARQAAAFGLHADIAAALDCFGLFLTQGMEAAETPLVALAPCGDAASEP